MQTLNILPNIVILGCGNVATHLSEALLNAGYSVLQCWKRGEVLKDADLYFIAESDDAIEDVANLIPEHKFFAHTSGTVDLSKGGVFYPLQTFSKNIDVDWQNIPILIEACDKNLEILLLEIARKISVNVQLTNTEQRRQIHLTAVFACNFTNHLWTLSEELLNQKNIPFDLLKPLIYQTVWKTEKSSPKNVQTGPAIRNDLSTLEKHRELLSKSDNGETNPLLLEIYNIISKSIQHTHGSH